MMHGHLADLGKPGVLGKIGDIAVHFPVDFHVLHNIFPIGLEAAVHVVQLDAGDAAGGSVVELRGQVLGDGIVLAVLLPSGN